MGTFARTYEILMSECRIALALTWWMFSGVTALEGSVLMKNTHMPVRATSFPSVTNTLGFLTFPERGCTPPEELCCPTKAKRILISPLLFALHMVASWYEVSLLKYCPIGSSMCLRKPTTWTISSLSPKGFKRICLFQSCCFGWGGGGAGGGRNRKKRSRNKKDGSRPNSC